jgi:hypothetical protein
MPIEWDDAPEVQQTGPRIEWDKDSARLAPSSGIVDGFVDMLKSGAATVGRIGGAVAKGAKTGFGDETLGMSPKTEQSFREAGIFGDDGAWSPIQSLNEDMFRTVAPGLDAVMRGGSAAIVGVAEGVGQTLQETGASPTVANKLVRDTHAFVQSLGFTLSAPVAGGPKVGPRAAGERLAATDVVREADPAGMAKVPDAPDATVAVQQAVDKLSESAQNVIDAAANPFGPLPEEMFTTRVAPEMQKGVVDAAVQLLTEGGVSRHPEMKLSDQVADLLATNRLQPEQVTRILSEKGVSFEDFAKVWREDIASSARDLGRLGIASQKLKAMYKDLSPAELQELGSALATEGLDSMASAGSIWRQIDDVRRGALVVQPVTAIRNLETQLGRVGMDTMTKLLDDALSSIGRRNVEEIHPVEAFAVMGRLFQKNKALADEILGYYPVEQDKLFSRYMSDLNRAQDVPGARGVVGKGIEKAREAVDWLNGLNRFQEYAIRRAVFVGSMERALMEKGLPGVADLEAAGRLHTIPHEIIRDSVTASLEATFSKNYNPTSLAGAFINVVNKSPLRIPIPFPRFLANSIEYLYDYNPTGYLKLLSPLERQKVAAGDFSTISKATVGSGMLMAAYQLRGSEYAGDKWYELKGEDGTVVDIRAFNPFASYVFVADVIKRMNNGTIGSMTAKDLLTGVLAVNLRAGTGLALVDQMLDGIAADSESEKIEKWAKTMAGEYLSGFTVFLGPLKDLVAQFDHTERAIKDTSSMPFWGPFLKRIPGATQNFPDVELATRTANPKGEAPLLRQSTGIALRTPKNALEAELDRLGFKRSDYSPTLGDPEADRLVNKYLGQIAEAKIVPMVTSEGYQSLGDRTRAFYLASTYQDARKAARSLAAEENPLLFAKLKMQAIPEDRRMMILEQSGVDLTGLFKQPGK